MSKLKYRGNGYWSTDQHEKEKEEVNAYMKDLEKMIMFGFESL